jgi:hypothetical protein
MTKSVEFCQLVARAIDHVTWSIPRIRDGGRWRVITNPHLVENPTHVNAYDHFENSIFLAKQIMEERGWETEITSTQEKCHEHLVYQHYRLRCWK